jgi:type I restriction enzyme S subunit
VPMKDSGIEWLGEIPEHWDLKKIKWIADVYGGSTPSSSTEEFWNGDINWVTTDDLGSLNDRFIITTQRKITEAGLNNIGKSLAPIGSLVISNRAPIGHIGLLKVDAATNQGCKSIIFKRNINSEFYYYCLLNSKEQLDSLGRGTTFKELSTQSLKDFITVFPPYFEQTVIANFLNLKTQQIDDQIKLIQQEISLIQEYKTSLINETVTGKIDVRDYQINHVTV